MRSFQIYRQASPDQKKRIDGMERQINRIQDEVSLAEAKFDYWKASLMFAAGGLRNAEDKLCEYLENLEEEMTK